MARVFKVFPGRGGMQSVGNFNIKPTYCIAITKYNVVDMEGARLLERYTEIRELLDMIGYLLEAR